MKLISHTTDEIREIEEKISSEGLFGFDYECTSSDPHKKAPLQHDKLRVVGFSFGFQDGSKTYVPIAHSSGPSASQQDALGLLEKVLPDKRNEVWAHNLKYEQMVTHTLGFEIANGRCSMIAQYLLDKALPGNKGLKLKAAVKEYLGRTMETWEEVTAGFRAHQISSERMASYGADDGLGSLELGMLWMPEIIEQGQDKVFIELECPFVDVLVHMREVGFGLDTELLYWMYDELSQDVRQIKDEFGALTRVDISSSKQLQVLYVNGMWPTKGISVGKSGAFSTGKEARGILRKVLKKGTVAYRALELKTEYAELSKLNSTYTKTLAEKAALSVDGRLRCDFNQTRTSTGRLSSSDPNLQNIPSVGSYAETIRDAFIAEDGWCILDADYSQADLRMMAHLSKDPKLLAAYREGRDLHQQTADECKCTRKQGKVLNLGEIYEMQAGTFAKALDISYDLATMYHNNWNNTYPFVRAYQQRMHAYARKHGYVKTITGRRRYFPDINSHNKFKRGMAERAASNAPDQGSVADVIKIAMRNLFREWKERGVLYDYWTKEGKVKILSQVHDEILVEARQDFTTEARADLIRHMENAVELRVPMKAGAGKPGRSWLAAYPD